MTERFKSKECGFEIFGLRNDAVEVRIVPALGARILGLRDLRSGREWLDRPLGGRLFRNTLGDNFETSTFAGSDDCIPTVAPSHWRNRDLPDHGEVWSRPCALDLEAWEKGEIRTFAILPITPLAFSRTVSLDGDWVTLDYEVMNMGTEPESFLWSLHPLIAIDAGDQLQLPPEIQNVRVELTGGVLHSPPGTLWTWPSPSETVHLDRLDLGGEAFAKFFAGPLRNGLATVANKMTGACLEFHWSADENPWLGIWLTCGAFRGFHHLAIEPSNGNGDTPNAAAQNSSLAEPLAPSTSRTWRVRLHLINH